MIRPLKNAEDISGGPGFTDAPRSSAACGMAITAAIGNPSVAQMRGGRGGGGGIRAPVRAPAGPAAGMLAPGIGRGSAQPQTPPSNQGLMPSGQTTPNLRSPGQNPQSQIPQSQIPQSQMQQSGSATAAGSPPVTRSNRRDRRFLFLSTTDST